MKNLVLVPILLLSLLIGGCGSGTMPVALGFAGGLAASETVKGIEVDLDNREKQLFDEYTAGVKAGATKEVLDIIEKKITETQYVREGVDAGKKLLGVDWNNPKEAGESILKLGVLAYAILTKKKLLGTQNRQNKFMANTDKETANRFYDKVVKKT